MRNFMNRKWSRLFLSLVLILGVMGSLVAAENLLSVPIEHRVYSVLHNAEMRGIIAVQHNVRPYSTSKILKDLNTILLSNSITREERLIVSDIIRELDHKPTDNSFASMATYGSYSQYLENIDTYAEIGARLGTQYSQSLSTIEAIDWRNSVEVYLRGDVRNIFSFEMNLGRLFDHIDHRLFFNNDFYLDA